MREIELGGVESQCSRGWGRRIGGGLGNEERWEEEEEEEEEEKIHF